MPVAIAGMHRSGTSMLARILNLVGLDLGAEDDMVPADPNSNAKGHWEHVAFLEINNRVLESLGGESNAPPLLPDGWRKGRDVTAFIREAAELGSRNIAHSGDLWGWKDPRTSLLPGFWAEAIPNLRFICCVRNPLSVAASLHRRDKTPEAHGVALWYYYNDVFLSEPLESRPIVCHYSDMMRDWRSTLAPICDALGLPRVVPGSDLEREIDSFVDPKLAHFEHSIDDLKSSPHVTLETVSLYEQLAGLKNGETANVEHAGILARTTACCTAALFDRVRLRNWAEALDVDIKRLQNERENLSDHVAGSVLLTHLSRRMLRRLRPH